MVRRFYDLPSLTSLAVFEASARHLSFTRAGQELNVTPGAVSRQIKGLEAEIGCALFARAPGGVTLTPEGEALYAVLSRTFSETAETFHRIRGGGRERSVTVGATTAFASLWLMPRLGGFWRTHPEVLINHIISDSPRDLRLAQVDLRIRYGDGAWPDEDSHHLFGDRIYPVCGAGFAARHGRIGDVAALAALPLIQLDANDPDWTRWEEWLQRLGHRPGPLRTIRFTSYVIALQAAEDDQGLALGWDSLVRPLIEAGRLVRPSSLEIPAPAAFYLTSNANRALGGEAAALRDWLLAQARRQGLEAADRSDVKSNPGCEKGRLRRSSHV